ncbi:hypothetical protein [Spirillospora sp. CA-294931]|uniref:hypothetical protein n=1 Tax=Spirillospora sp. CA-294931 TaxID=3240042 RepID=UPI003D8A26C5
MEFTSDERITENTVALLEDLDDKPLALIARSGAAKAVVDAVVPEPGPVTQFTVAGFNSFIPGPVVTPPR